MPRRAKRGSRKGGTFSPLIPAPKVQTLIIVVPGIGTALPESWRDKSGTGRLWLEHIPNEMAPGAAAFSYSHGIVSSGLSWTAVLEEGARFIEALLQHIEHLRLQHCPIVIVSHSLGGLIVKEALRLSYENGYKTFLRALAGVILLGTPHSNEEADPKWQKAGMAMPDLSKKNRSLSTDDIASLASSSMKFERAAVKVPILSVHETKETKVKMGFITSRKTLLMDAAFVKTGSHNEEVLPVDLDHNTLCCLSVTAEYFARILEFLESSLRDARFRIIQGSPKFDPVTTGDDWTVVGEDIAESIEALSTSFGSGSIPNTQLSQPRTLNAATVGSSDFSFENVPQFNSITWQRPPSRFPLFLVSVPRNRYFFGRQKPLAAIDEAFFSEKEQGSPRSANIEARTFAICGPGGMGKTQLAAEYAHTRKDRFTAVFWVQAASAQKLQDEFGRLAIALGLVEEDSSDARDHAITRDLVKGWLANPARSSDDVPLEQKVTWLLIFDNLDDPEVLQEFWPLDGPGCILFTSRDPLVKSSVYLASDGIDLESFSMEESSSFLDKLTGNKNRGDSSGVYARLRGLPLAITQMASIIIRRDLTYGEFVDSYDEVGQHKELFQERHGDKRHQQSSDQEKTIWSVWALDDLKKSRPLLDVLSFLDPDGILERTLIVPILSAGLPLIEKYPRSNNDYQKARTELLQSSLVTKDSTGKRLIVHRLIQDTSRAKMSPAHYRKSFSSALHLISAVWPYESFGWRHAISRWKVCEELFPHVVCLRRLGASIAENKDDIEVELVFCKLLTDAGWYYHERGHSSDSKPFFDLALTLCDYLKPLIGSSPNPTSSGKLAQLNAILAELHHNQGCIGTETNDPKSTLEHFKKFNEMMVAESGDEIRGKDKRLAISWNELGNAYMMNKMWKKGEECFKNSIESAQLLKDYKPVDTSFPYVNLGLSYWFMGRNEEAIKALLTGLQAREEAYGVDDTHSFITGRFLHALGNVRESQGKLDESFLYHRRALHQYKETIGKSHHRTGDVHVRVADHFLREGKADEAESELREALHIFGSSAVFDNERARALHRLSLVLAKRGEHDKSAETRGEAVTLYQQLYPQSRKPVGELDKDDFDDAVTFWSR